MIRKSSCAAVNLLQGGAVSIGAGSLADIRDSSFTWNEASSGGALYVSELGVAEISRADFANNVALQFGGAMHVGGMVNIDESTFHENTGLEGVSVACSWWNLDRHWLLACV